MESRNVQTTTLTDEEIEAAGATDPEDLAFLEKLKANGVQLATKRWGGPYELGKPRPWWVAFIVRVLRKLRIYEDV